MGIPVDPTTGNLVGSVPQLLQFQNDFLPAQATTQIDYRANLASYPLTQAHDTNIPGSELLDPRDALGQPDRGRAASPPRSPASVPHLADVIATVTGTGTFATAGTALGAGNGGLLRLIVTPSGGSPTTYDLNFLATDTLTNVVNTINTTAGLSSAVVASIDTSGGTNKLVLTSATADYDFDVNIASTDTLTTGLGLDEVEPHLDESHGAGRVAAARC